MFLEPRWSAMWKAILVLLGVIYDGEILLSSVKPIRDPQKRHGGRELLHDMTGSCVIS